jgi:alkaline phosphatase
MSICAASTVLGAAAERTESTPATYVFYFIGDGMGRAQRAAAEEYLRAIAGSDKMQLAMSMLPVQGRTTTASANEPVTDSAAAGTALSTGMKTNNGVLGMNPSGSVSYQTIAEKAKALGKRVGIISSVSLDHATPAAFYAHVSSRGEYARVADALSQSGFDFFAGGGLTGQAGAGGVDNLDLARKRGYTIARTREELRALAPGSKAYAFNARLAGGHAMPYAIDLREDDLTLAECVGHGIRLLDNPNGFFMMVEGGKIDWACHNNDLATAVQDTLAFDDAVHVALRFARSHADETLIVVTADHETGGLRRLEAGGNPAVLLDQIMSAERFNEELRPYTRKKAPLASVRGLIRLAFGLQDLTAAQDSELSDAWAATLGDTVRDRGPYGGKVPLTIVCQRIVARLAGYEYTTFGHTGADVLTSACGVAAGRFAGTNDNTDLAAFIAQSLEPRPVGITR